MASVFEGLSQSSGLANPNFVWALVQKNKSTHRWRVASEGGREWTGVLGKKQKKLDWSGK